VSVTNVPEAVAAEEAALVSQIAAGDFGAQWLSCTAGMADGSTASGSGISATRA